MFENVFVKIFVFFMIVKMPRKSTGSVARSRKCSFVHLKTLKKMMLVTNLMLVKDLINDKLNYHFSGEKCVTDKKKN